MDHSVESYGLEDEDLFFPCDDILASTSLENKSIVLTEMHNLAGSSSSSLCLIEMGNKYTYNKVIRELMIYYLHKKYIHRMYRSVLLQLINEWRTRQHSRFYLNLIS
jgi:hypothetical protein